MADFNLGRAIKLARASKGMSQSDLAAAAGISVPYLSLLEQNKRNPNLSTVNHIARALGLPLFLLAALASGNEELNLLGHYLAGQLSWSILKHLKTTTKGNDDER